MKKATSILLALIMVLTLAACNNSTSPYALVENPSEAYIVECLQKISGITGIEAATEDNDPNGQLNKAGGYTAHVYFAHELVDPEELYEDGIIANGTDSGGSIEVYATEEDALERDAYLAGFDGTAFASGSHTVVGTVVVRTSNLLTASQQKALEAEIVDTLLGNP